MKQIIPFKKELPFKTKVSEITSISLERDINVLDDGIVTGAFHITGDYKMNEGSINREEFSFELPFDITLDPRYDIKTVNSDIEDFYYDVLNEDTLLVNVDLYVEAEYLPDNDINKIEISSLPEDIFEEKIEEEVKEDVRSIEIENVNNNVNINDNSNVNDDGDIFSNLDDSETYVTYYVYIVKEDDTLDKILTKYDVSKEDVMDYNDITDIKPGDKIIIPKTNE